MFIHLTRIQGTIYKCNNTTIIDNTIITHHNPISIHGVRSIGSSRTSIHLDLLDLTFAELFYGFIRFTKWSQNSSMVILIIFIPWTFLQYFLNKGGNVWTKGETGQLAEFFYGIFMIFHSRYPSQGTPSQATLTQEKKKVWTLQPKPSQARGAVWGAAWEAAQARCRSAALPSDYITTPVALVQCCSTEQQWAAAAAAGRLRSISLVCWLHNTITLHLTAVKSSPSQGQLSIYMFFSNSIFYSNNVDI